MCIILTCERGARPTRQLLETCFENNPDGAGIMWHEGCAVQVCKGFATCSELARAIDAAPADSPLVIHMRIATSGGVSAGVCHPFPICDNLEALHAENVECGAAVAHNGVITGVSTDDARGVSDTVAFTAGVLNGMWRRDNVLTRRMRGRIMRAAPSNRFAIMNAGGAVYRIGKGWNTAARGIEASNDSWRCKYSSLLDTDCGAYEYGAPYGGAAYAEALDYFCYGCEYLDICKRYGAECDGIEEAINGCTYDGVSLDYWRV